MAEATNEGFKLTVSADQVRGFIQEALVKALSPTERDRLVTEAITQLMKGSWQSPSDLQRVFSDAVTAVARSLAMEEMNKPENVEKLRALVAEAWDRRIIGKDREKLVEKVGAAIAHGIFGRDPF